jgi:hypothetical protein
VGFAKMPAGVTLIHHGSFANTVVVIEEQNAPNPHLN